MIRNKVQELHGVKVFTNEPDLGVYGRRGDDACKQIVNKMEEECVSTRGWGIKETSGSCISVLI